MVSFLHNMNRPNFLWLALTTLTEKLDSGNSSYTRARNLNGLVSCIQVTRLAMTFWGHYNLDPGTQFVNGNLCQGRYSGCYGNSFEISYN